MLDPLWEDRFDLDDPSTWEGQRYIKAYHPKTGVPVFEYRKRPRPDRIAMTMKLLGEMLECGDKITEVNPPREGSPYGNVRLQTHEGAIPAMFTIEAEIWGDISEAFGFKE